VSKLRNKGIEREDDQTAGVQSKPLAMAVILVSCSEERTWKRAWRQRKTTI